MWFGEGKTAYQRDRILPSGQSQLLINLGPPQYRIEPGPPENRVPFVDVWYSGLHQGPIDTEAPHGNALLGVAFTARGTFPWLGERMDGLSDRIIALADALGDGALRAARAAAEHALARSAFQMRRALAAGAAQAAHHRASGRALGGGSHRGDRRAHRHRRSRDADRLHAQASRQPVPAAGGPLAQSRWRACIASVARWHCSITADGQVPWAALAEQCGYYDQSHLINEFRRFTGFSPVELARRDRPDAQSVVIR